MAAPNALMSTTEQSHLLRSMMLSRHRVIAVPDSSSRGLFPDQGPHRFLGWQATRRVEPIHGRWTNLVSHVGRIGLHLERFAEKIVGRRTRPIQTLTLSC
jgi:hypothetical protein